MMGLIRIATVAHTFMVWLTLLVTIGVAWAAQGLPPTAITLTCLGVILQTVLGAHNVLKRRAFPLQRVLLHHRPLTHPHLKPLLLCALVPLPVVASLSVTAGVLWLGAVFLIYAPETLPLAARLFRRKQALAELKAGLVAAPPEVVVFIAGSREAAYQINQWLPVLERLPFRVAVLSGSLQMVDGMHPTKLPVFFAASHAEVEWFLSTGTKIVLYPANPVDNARPLRQYQLMHFFINHGESDKAVNQSKLLMAYDKLLVGGPLAERRLLDAGLPVRPGQVVHIGRPQAELLLECSTEPVVQIRNILYAPTWEGLGENVNYSSVAELGVALVRTLLGDPRFELRFKPHPFTGSRSAATRHSLSAVCGMVKAAGKVVLGDSDSLHEAMNWSDLLITDVSSVLNEFLVTNKPIVVCNPQHLHEAEMHGTYPSSRAAYILNDAAGFSSLIEHICASDPKATTRLEVRKDSLGDFEGSALERFTRVLGDSLKAH